MRSRNRFSTVFLSVIIFISFLVSLGVALRRDHFEQSLTQTDLVVSFNEMKRLAVLSGLSMEDLLNRLKNDSHITSVAVEEKTLQTYIDAGKMTLIQGAEVNNLYRIGHVNRLVLNYIYKLSRPEHYYLIIDERADFERIRDIMMVEFGADKVREFSRWNIIEVLDEKEDLLEVGLGFDTAELDFLSKNGFGVILRPKNSRRLTEELIRIKFQRLGEISNLTSVIFDGPVVLGYPDKIEDVYRQLSELGLNLGVVEFFSQLGIDRLQERMPEGVLRVHSISLNEMNTISKERAARRYVRAAKERGIRILFVHPFFTPFQGEGFLTPNIEYFNDIYNRLNELGFKVEPIHSFPSSSYVPAKPWEILLISLGATAAALLLLNYLFSVSTFVIITAFIGVSVLFYFYLTNWPLMWWTRGFALLTALVFPPLALISRFPAKYETADSRMRFVHGIGYLIALTGITVVGGLFIASLLSDVTYLFGIYRFFGVKISFLIPLFAVGLYFYLRPHRVTSVYYVFKRLSFEPVRAVSLLAAVAAIGFIFIYILRSGNYTAFWFPQFEDQFRNILEDVFTIRPRTKEFLLGYPMLYMAYVYVDRQISRNWLWFFNILGAVALISVINTLCHLHTPLLVSGIRILWGLAAGIVVSLIYLVGAYFARLLFKKLQ